MMTLYYPGLADKKNGNWGWADWLTRAEKTKFKYETPEELQYPRYEQYGVI